MKQLSRRQMIAFGSIAGLVACTTAEQEAILGAVIGSTGSGGSGLTTAEAVAGIKEALNNGVGAAIAQVGRTNGYLLDNVIHIPLPGRLASIQSNLAQVGLSGMLDDLERQLNRGAEAAAPVARRVFVDAISAMTIQDAIGIVRGSKTSATEYFQRTTTPELTRLFRPIMTDALQRAGAIQTFDQLAARVANVPLLPQLGADAKDDLIDHGVGKGLEGMFHYIGREEAAIRENPAKRTSEILRKVFG